MFVRDGYVCAFKGWKRGRVGKRAKIKNIFLIKENGLFVVRNIKFPKEYVGKKIRFKVEVVDDLNVKF